MKELDNMGSLHDMKKPDFLSEDNTIFDLTNDEIQFTLNDLYQFLLFDGETPESTNKMPENEYEELERNLIESIFKIQHTTVGKALKRVIKKISTKDQQVQSSFEPFQEQISKMKELTEELYQDKYKLKFETETFRKENLKLKQQLEDYSDQIKEYKRNGKFSENTKDGQNQNRFSSDLDSKEVADLNRKIESYKEAIK